MNPVIHFELPADDRKRMMAFYSKVFGWQSQQLGPEMSEYVVVSTAEVDPKTDRPKEPGSINGGFFQRTDDPNAQHPTVVISVDNLEESIEKVKHSGGTILSEPTDIPGIGRYVSFVDTEKNRLGILQPVPMEK